MDELDIALEDFNPNNKFAEPEIEYGIENDTILEDDMDEETGY